MASKRVPPLVTREGETREILLALAEMHGVRNRIAALLMDRPDPPQCRLPLHMLLRQHRVANGWTKEQVAARMNLPRKLVYELEAGRIDHKKNARMATLAAVAIGYQLPLGLILSATLRQAGLLPAPGAVEKATRIRKRTGVQ